MWILVAAIIGSILLAFILLFSIIFKTDRSPTTTGNLSSPSPSLANHINYQPPTDFLVYNYFPRHSINVVVVNPRSGSQKVLATSIAPLSTSGIQKEDVTTYMVPGNIIRVHIISASGETKHFSDLVIDHPTSERIKNLHVGMVTTRFIGSTDVLRMTTNAGNANQGTAWLKIHNLSLLPLRLNDDIVVDPQSRERYKGYLNQGVTLGMIFKDQDELYPDFQYLQPHSDLYYGIVSDLRQPTYGPWQQEFSDECDMDQTLWPLELGHI